MKRIVFPLMTVLSLLLLSVVAAGQQQQSCLQQLQGLKLEILSGTVNTHYSPGQRERALKMKTLLEEAGSFYSRSLDLKPVVTLAALGPAEWPAMLDKPYGLPTLRMGPCRRGPIVGPPQYVAVMPITAGGPLYNDWIAMKGSLTPGTLKKFKKLGMTHEQGGQIMLDFVALHELGHAYAHAMGIETVSGFLAEFTADYFAYAFLRSTKDRLDKRTMAVLTANTESITPIHASLDKFETFQSREHPPTEAWYNSTFTVKAAEIYDAKGWAFMREVRDAFANEKYQSINNDEILKRLDRIQPGFIAWSNSLGKKRPS